MYQAQHDVLFASIRSGKTINDGEWMANSTRVGILGTLAAYTGQEVTWEQAFNSKHSIDPEIDEYVWDMKWEKPLVPIPGITKFR